MDKLINCTEFLILNLQQLSHTIVSDKQGFIQVDAIYHCIQKLKEIIHRVLLLINYLLPLTTYYISDISRIGEKRSYRSIQSLLVPQIP